MAIWGKLVGTAAGFAMGGVIGALLGAVAGHAFDQWRAEGQERRRLGRGQAEGRIGLDPIEMRRVAFATAVIVLAAKLAKVDGVVRPDEIRAFKRIFKIGDEDVGDVAAIYNEAKRDPAGFEPFAMQIANLFRNEPAVLEELLIGLFEVARADGALDQRELRFLAAVAAIFGFRPAEFEAIRARFQASSERPPSTAEVDPYAVLGLTRAASDEEVRAAWKRLVKEHHPDRLTARGMPPEFVEKATRTLAGINAAYDRIAQERGLR